MTQQREDFVAGIDFGGTKVALVTADLEGRRLAARRIPAQAGDGADGVVERALAGHIPPPRRRAIRSAGSECWVADGAHGAAGEPLTTGQVFAQAGSNARPQQMVSGALDALAAHIADLALVVDPATIAVGGEFAHVAGIILPRLRATLERTVPVPPTVRVARFTQDATVVGAVALALALDAALLSGRPASAPPQDDRPAPHEHRKAS